MNNKEFARVLLCEATELLNESGNRRKYVKATENEIKRLEKLETHATGDRKKEIENKRGELRKKLNDVAPENFYNNIHPSFLHKDSTKPTDILNKETDNIGTNNILHRGQQNKGKDNYKKIIKSEMDARSGHVNKQLHANINNRSQNESIAILLTEAALLLNEDTRYNKEYAKTVSPINSKFAGKTISDAMNARKDIVDYQNDILQHERDAKKYISDDYQEKLDNMKKENLKFISDLDRGIISSYGHAKVLKDAAKRHYGVK